MAYILKAYYFLLADNLVTTPTFCILSLDAGKGRSACSMRAFCLASERSVTSHFSTGNVKMKHRLINDTGNKDNLDQTLGIFHGKLEDAH